MSSDKECCKIKNPLYSNAFFKLEKHNACRPQALYSRIISQMIMIYGYTLFYYPVTEYSLNTLSAIWGEDPQPAYREKYTFKALTEGENDVVSFNTFGAQTFDQSDRVIMINKQMFRDITGREEPTYSDHLLWTQNKIIYQVENFTDNDNIVLGEELWWTVFLTPRIVEGQIFGKDDCDAFREDAIDPDLSDPTSKSACYNKDGNIKDNPDIQVPGPRPKKNDDEFTIERDDDVLIRNSWGEKT